MPDKDFVTQHELDIRTEAHQKLHHIIEKETTKADLSMRRALESALAAHAREHELHQMAHEREHVMATTALNKAEISMNTRLEGMNEFRNQLNSQAASFVNRDAFERYAKETEAKVELALSTSNEKNDTVTKALINRHDADYNTLRELLQGEREARKTLEGSINTWKWIASFLGASGVAGVILLFATGSH